MKDFHYTSMKGYFTPSSSPWSYCLFTPNWIFWWGNEVKGPKMILFWCLMPKGEKLRAKASKWISYHLRILKIVELGLLICQNSLVVSFVKSWSLVGRMVDYGEKGGVFEIFDQSILEWLSLCFNMCVWLRDRDLSLICKNKPSGGKGWSIYAKIE